MFAMCKNLSKHVANLYVCITVSNVYPNYIQKLLRVLDSCNMCKYFLLYKITRFASVFSHLIVFVLMRDERSKRHLFEVTMST